MTRKLKTAQEAVIRASRAYLLARAEEAPCLIVQALLHEAAWGIWCPGTKKWRQLC